MHKFQADQYHSLYSNYFPIDIEYQLFNVYWSDIVAIFAFYEESALQWLMKSPIQRWPGEIFFSYGGREDSLQCWVTSDSQGHLFRAAGNLLHSFGDSLAEQRLQEFKAPDTVRTITGHARVVDRCLQVL